MPKLIERLVFGVLNSCILETLQYVNMTTALSVKHFSGDHAGKKSSIEIFKSKKQKISL